MEPDWKWIADQMLNDRANLVKSIREIAEQIKRCDYAQARSNALEVLKRYE